jgi:ABC-type multidrug transport system permease subunit
MYSALPYAVAQGTVEVPYIFVQALFFSVITYFLYHLQVDAGELLFALMCISQAYDAEHV